MEKMIGNPGQAYAAGGTWGTPSVDNQMTTEQCDLINGTGTNLYTGDIVALDPTGTMAILPTTATLSLVIGAVGSTLEASSYPAVENINGANVTNTFPVIVGGAGGVGISSLTTDGNVQPFQDNAFQSLSLGFTNGSATVTYAAASSSFLGQYIYIPYNATTNLNPQILQIVSAIANTSFGTVVVSGAGTTFSGTTGTFVCQVGRDTVLKGPGWQPLPGWTNVSPYPPGAVVPLVIRGFGRVNCSGLSTLVAGSFVLGTNGSTAGSLVLITALTAAQTGLVIATALEPYAQRDTSLTTSGVVGHDTVRAIIGKV